MKVLQLGKFYPILGGVEKVMWDLTLGLSETGVDCDMLCATTGKGGTIRLNTHGNVICIKAWGKLAATMIAPGMVGWLRKHAEEYDIIHIHHPDPMACLSLYLSEYKGRVILHWHSDIIKQHFLLNLYAPLLKWLVRRAETVIGTTPVYLEASPWFKDFQGKTATVPIGIKPLVVEKDAVLRWRKQFEGKKIVLSVGRLVPYKGYGYLVAAAERLGPEYQVIIAGEGPERKHLLKMIESSRRTNPVLLPGYLDDHLVHALLAACDVFVLPSVMKTEAFGIVQIEAMSLGKPVIATDIPGSGVPWVNQHGVTGLNVPVRDSDSLAEAIRRICEDDALREEMSREALKRFDQFFTIEQMVDNTRRIYLK